MVALYLIAGIAVLAVIIFAVRSLFWKRAMLITYFTVFVTQLATWITSTDFFSLYVYPENLALKDFDLMDYAMANLRQEAQLDDRIVIVNIGDVGRREIAKEINIISKFRPRVIGIDAFFNCPPGPRDSANCPYSFDTLASSQLSTAIRNAGNVILSIRLWQTNATLKSGKDALDSAEYSDPMFHNYADTSGFTNLPIEEGRAEQINIVRYLSPKEKMGDLDQISLATAVVQRFDPMAAKRFLDRNNSLEVINFRRNIGLNQEPTKYNLIDVADLLNRPIDSAKFRKIIESKIVMMGYIGTSYGDLSIQQVFYTPFNKMTYGRSLPDMFGIVLHANIVSMILDEDYINEVSNTGEMLIGFITCLLHVALLIWLSKKLPRWFDLLALALVVLQLFIGSWLRLHLFTEYNIKTQLYFTLASLAIASISINISRELFHLLKPNLPRFIQSRLI